MKYCNVYKEWKKISDFHNSSYSEDKKQINCTKCVNSWKKYYDKCEVEGCTNKPVPQTKLCIAHNKKRRCKYNGCTRHHSHKLNGYCKTHGKK